MYTPDSRGPEGEEIGADGFGGWDEDGGEFVGEFVGGLGRGTSGLAGGGGGDGVAGFGADGGFEAGMCVWGGVSTFPDVGVEGICISCLFSSVGLVMSNGELKRNGDSIKFRLQTANTARTTIFLEPSVTIGSLLGGGFVDWFSCIAVILRREREGGAGATSRRGCERSEREREA